MSPRYYLLAGMLALAIAACQSDKKEIAAEKANLETTLPGTWETIYMKVKSPTFEKSDSTSVFEASEEYWEARFGVKPYRTYFSEDKKFHTVYRGLNGTLISEVSGIWNAFGDTLMMVEPKATSQYKVLAEKGRAHFSAVMDWDGDGEEDDEVYFIYRLISKSSKE